MAVTCHAQRRTMLRTEVPTDSIYMSDPFILADSATMTYYMTGTGGMLWKSKDLRRWERPYRIAQTNPDSWMGQRPMIWAAELHKYKGKYYYFATFTNREVFIDSVKGNKIVGNFEKEFVEAWGIGVQVANADDTALADNAATLCGAAK